MKQTLRFFATLLCALAPFGWANATFAATDTAYHVRLDISSLAGLGVFNAEFQLTDGSGTGNDNSRVSITNVLLTNGQLGAVLPPTQGNVTGNLSTTLLLRDGPGAALADFAQGFSVTDTALPAYFDFDVTLTHDALEPSSSAPDNFAFLLLNDDGSQTLPTDGPTGGEVASAPFDRAAPILTGYASQQNSTPFLSSPNITPLAAPSTAPEPASLLYLAFAGVCFAGAARRGRCDKCAKYGSGARGEV